MGYVVQVTMIEFDILHTIWERSDPGLVFLPVKSAHSGEWFEGEGYAPDMIEADDFLNVDGYDQYFTPGTFRSGERIKENVVPTGVLYADLDDEFNYTHLNDLWPSLLVETSAGRFQAVWLLDGTLSLEAHADLNQRLSHYLEADHGSWIPTKVLRVPGTINWKRGGEPVEVKEWDPDRVFGREEFDYFLPSVEARPISEGASAPDTPSPQEWAALRDELWPTLDRRTKEMLTIRMPADRSLHLSQLATRMANLGIPDRKIFGLLSRLPSNKFRGRPEVLFNSVVLTATNRR